MSSWFFSETFGHINDCQFGNMHISLSVQHNTQPRWVHLICDIFGVGGAGVLFSQFLSQKKKQNCLKVFELHLKFLLSDLHVFLFFFTASFDAMQLMFSLI